MLECSLLSTRSSCKCVVSNASCTYVVVISDAFIRDKSMLADVPSLAGRRSHQSFDILTLCSLGFVRLGLSSFALHIFTHLRASKMVNLFIEIYSFTFIQFQSIWFCHMVSVWSRRLLYRKVVSWSRQSSLSFTTAEPSSLRQLELCWCKGHA